MQNAPIELVVTDLDGTLWAYGSEGVPHERTLAAWAELDRRGVPVLVATGRRATTAREPLAEYGLAPSAVVLNGALALDLATGTLLPPSLTTTSRSPSACSPRSVGRPRAVRVRGARRLRRVHRYEAVHEQAAPRRARIACAHRRPRRDRGLRSGALVRRVRQRGARDHGRGRRSGAPRRPSRHPRRLRRARRDRRPERPLEVERCARLLRARRHRPEAVCSRSATAPTTARLLTNATIALVPEDAHEDALEAPRTTWCRRPPSAAGPRSSTTSERAFTPTSAREPIHGRPLQSRQRARSAARTRDTCMSCARSSSGNHRTAVMSGSSVTDGSSSDSHEEARLRTLGRTSAVELADDAAHRCPPPRAARGARRRRPVLPGSHPTAGQRPELVEDTAP